MQIFITGGSGFVGTFLTKKLTETGHEVTILTRKIREGRRLPEGASFFEGDPKKTGPWQKKLAKHEVIINLAGASIFNRWNSRTKKEIYDSRILTTRHIVEALADRQGRETHFFSTSAVGYYGFHGDEALYEKEPPGNDFLSRVASDWEAAALKAEAYGARVVICRFGLVMGKHGGAIETLLPVFKWYLGAPLGTGKQWFSWVHEQDLANIFLFLLTHKDLAGPFNCTAPNPVRNREMTKILGRVLHRPTWFFPVPGFMLRMILGEFAGVVVKGQKVLPKKLIDSGYEFEFPTFREALENVFKA